MSIPSRLESAALLLSLDPPAWHLRHSRAVAETAGWLAWRAIEAAGGSAAGRPDRRLVEAAALLHDVDKLPAVRSTIDGLAHAEGSARWLAERGHPELGPAIVGHPVTRLADAAWFTDWLSSASPEALIVAYADKRAGQRLEPMAARFESWTRRYPPADRAAAPGSGGGWPAEAVAGARRRALELEARVCAMAGVAPAEVRRLEWTGRALRRARSGR
jgi:hypothetical protein